MDDPKRNEEDCPQGQANKKGGGSKGKRSGRRPPSKNSPVYPLHQYNYHRGILSNEIEGSEGLGTDPESRDKIKDPKCGGLSVFEKAELEELRERIRSEELSRCLPVDLEKLERGKRPPPEGVCPSGGAPRRRSGQDSIMEPRPRKRSFVPPPTNDKSKSTKVGESEEDAEAEMEAEEAEEDAEMEALVEREAVGDSGVAESGIIDRILSSVIIDPSVIPVKEKISKVNVKGKPTRKKSKYIPKSKK